MPAPRRIIRPRSLHTTLPEDLAGKLDLHLFSALEGKVPKGAIQAFLIERIQEYFSWRRLSIEHLGFPQGFFIAGPCETVERLEAYIKQLQQGE